MPSKFSPLALRQTCLDSLALNLELLCYGHEKGTQSLKDIIETDQYKAFHSPFAELPSSLLEDLGSAIYNKRSGLKHLLSQVIHPQLDSFAIRLHGSTHVAMDLLSRRCNRSLKKLQMSYSINIPPVYYTEFFRHFVNLCSLNLHGSMVDDNAFKVIGANCNKLQELIASETWITDNGVKHLCVQNLQNEDGSWEEIQCCQYLNRLAVVGTRVTPHGLAFFLKHHPKAEHIDHEESLIMFELMKDLNMNLDSSSSNNNSYRLTKLSCTALTRVTDYDRDEDHDVLFNPGCRVNSRCLSRALSGCAKHLTTLDVTQPGLTDQDLIHVSQMAVNLASLHLTNCEGALHFDQGLFPILDRAGHKLTRLVLEKFAEVDVAVIGEHCSQLNHLALASIGSYVPVPEFSAKRFRHLTNLELWADVSSHSSAFPQQSPMCPTVLRQLLGPARGLSHLLLQGVTALDDQLLLQLWDGGDNSMHKLANVVFDKCQDISPLVIWKLLNGKNKLRVLRCWNCKQITEEDRQVIKTIIKDYRLNVYFEWYPYLPQENIR